MPCPGLARRRLCSLLPALLLAFLAPCLPAQAAPRQPAHLAQKQESAAQASPAASAQDPSQGGQAASGEPGKIHLFGTVEFKRPLDTLPGWLDVLKRNKADPIFLPQKHFNAATTWAQLREKAKGKSGLELLRLVNAFWNTWPYKEDMPNWGQPDYWAIPAQFIKRSGDCEDYAIAKYFTLKELGVPARDMRIAVVRDTLRNLAHAVLVVYLNGDAYVLDNLSNAVLPHSRFRHYSPQYTVNELGRWAHVKGRPKK